MAIPLLRLPLQTSSLQKQIGKRRVICSGEIQGGAWEEWGQLPLFLCFHSSPCCLGCHTANPPSLPRMFQVPGSHIQVTMNQDALEQLSSSGSFAAWFEWMLFLSSRHLSPSYPLQTLNRFYESQGSIWCCSHCVSRHHLTAWNSVTIY